MTTLWRDHPSLDLGIAGILAVVAMNLHVSSAGDALSSLGRGERRTFYAVLAVMAVVLLAAALNRRSGPERWCQGCLGLAAATATAALLLDVQDGPLRTVQLVVLAGLFLLATSTVRLIIGATDQPGGGSASSQGSGPVDAGGPRHG